MGEWLFRALLRLHPRRVRERYGEEMLGVYREHRQATRGRAWGAHALLEMRTTLGMIRSAADAWMDQDHDAARALTAGIGRRPLDATGRLASARRGPAGRPRLIGDSLRDVRMALRRMRREWVLTLSALLMLGVGLGAAAAVFTVAQAALLRPPPFTAPERLVQAWESSPLSGGHSLTSYATLTDWRHDAKSFSSLEGYNGSNVTVIERSPTFGEGSMLRGAQVTKGFFRALGVQMQWGRDFADEDGAGPEAVAIVSERLALRNGMLTDEPVDDYTTPRLLRVWDSLDSRFMAGQRPIPGIIRVNGTFYRIVGVLPNGFAFPQLQDADVFLPIVNEPASAASTDHSSRTLSVIGRLRDGASIDAGRTELSAITNGIAAAHPGVMLARSAAVEPLTKAMLGSVRPMLGGLSAAVALLFLAMCTNLALLMFTRHVDRMQELSMRNALGASRGRILRQLLAENVVLAAVGAGGALLIARVGVTRLLRMIPDAVRVGMPYLEGVAVSRSTALFVGGAALIATLAFGLGPASLAVRRAPRLTTSRASLGRGDRRLTRALVGGQVALSVVLLIGAGLLMGSLRNLLSLDVGWNDPSTLVVVRMSLSGPRYQSSTEQTAFYDEMIAKAAAIPGVEAAAAVDQLPLGGGGLTSVEAVGAEARPATTEVAFRMVAGDYFGVMGIPVEAARYFGTRGAAGSGPLPFGRPVPEGLGINPFENGLELRDSQGLIVVSHRMAELLGHGESVIGRRIRLAISGDREWEIIAVVGDVQTASLDEESPPAVYLSHLQRPENRMSIVVRTTDAPETVAAGLRKALQRRDPEVPVYSVGTLQQGMTDSRAVFMRRFPSTLASVFAAATFLLALIALAGVSAHGVQSRRRELAIRAVLGATAQDVRAGVLRDSALLAASGVAAGLLGALATTRLIRTLLFGVSPLDWRVYAGVAGLVLVCATLAALAPALSAAKVEPSMAMRGE